MLPPEPKHPANRCRGLIFGAIAPLAVIEMDTDIADRHGRDPVDRPTSQRRRCASPPLIWGPRTS